MKKIFLIILISILFLTGCGKNETNKVNEESKIDSTKLMINGFDLTLSEKSSFENLKFYYPKNAVISSLGTFTIVSYVKDSTTGELLFKISLNKFTNKTPKEVLETETTKKTSEKLIGDINWELYTDKDNNHLYSYSKDNDTYVVAFMPNGDIGNFEEEFLKKVSF